MFDAAGDVSSQYGSFGALVGHELSRGFDNKGRMVDAKGDLRDWWTPADVAAWSSISGRLAAQYDGYAWPVLKDVKVNGRRLNIASALLNDGDVVELTAKAITMVPVLGAIQSTEREVPDYLEADHAKGTVKLTRTPKLSDVPYPVQMNPNLIIEFYSR